MFCGNCFYHYRYILYFVNNRLEKGRGSCGIKAAVLKANLRSKDSQRVLAVFTLRMLCAKMWYLTWGEAYV